MRTPHFDDDRAFQPSRTAAKEQKNNRKMQAFLRNFSERRLVK
jgi:hypothetical protein